VIRHDSVPTELRVTATAADNPLEVHAVSHRSHPVMGVQFHPESIGTAAGMQMLRNFLTFAKET
jgi:anthranilate/para-aminobenzoate synthase component II